MRDIGEVDLDWAMPSASGYAPEAVKAQAVAARTYAVAKNGTLTDGWQDQYYAGYRLEAKYPGLARAAEETAGLILTYQGQARLHLLLCPLRRLHHRLGLVRGRLAASPTSSPSPTPGA